MRSAAQRRNIPLAGSAVLRDELTRTIKKAALQEFAASGYAGFSMEAVAKRARVGKAALYRRWEGKDAMILEVLSGGGLQFAHPPDTGTLEGDLIGYLRNAIAILRQPLNARIAAHLYAETNNDSGFGRLVRKHLQPVKRELAGQLLRRAIARGELDEDIDTDLIFDMLNGPLYWRLIVTRGETNDDYLRRLANFMLAGFRAQSSNSVVQVGSRRPHRSSTKRRA